MEIKIALAGNPNCGKTTLFNALTGSNQFVGNWPGVTVEKKEGQLKDNKDVIITDLPGIYSLSPYTLEEVVARNYLIQERPSAILNIIDGTNIERNLYLTTQLVELGIPVVVAINMMDVVEKNGDTIDTALLAKKLGCRICTLSASKGTGVQEAVRLAVEAAEKSEPIIPRHSFCGCAEHAIAHIEECVLHDVPEEQQRWYAIKIFERDEKVLEQMKLSEKTLEHIEKDIRSAEAEMDDESDSIIINERYNYVAKVISECYHRKNKNGLSISDKIDRFVTNRWLALPIFAAVMFIVYYISVSTVGTWTTDWTQNVLIGKWIYDGIEALLIKINCAGWLQGLVLDGIVSGVGTVLSFVPQMLVLFFFLSFLEACGYMSRIAFLMDKIFCKFGLSGKSFIPILIGTGCGVPGIMSSRTIENASDRRMTIITTTFIPCGAKLPMIGLIAGALFNNSGWVAASCYFAGIAAIVISGIMLKKTKPFMEEPSPFVMELPPYHMPTGANVFHATWDRGWSFIKKAGTVITLSSIIIWFLQNFGFENGSFGMIENIDRSILATIGNAVAWIFTPLGWGNWQSAVATVTGLFAKENIAASLGQLTGNGADGWDNLASAFTKLSAYSFLLFNLLCAPCVAAMSAIRREMNSAKWTAFAIGYQCGFAYVISLIIYQFGCFFKGNPHPAELLCAALAAAFIIFMLARHPSAKKNTLK